MEDVRSYYLSDRDKMFVWIVSTIILITYVYFLNVFSILGSVFAGFLLIGCLIIWMIASPLFACKDIECHHAGLLRFTFVIAFLCNVIGILSRNFALVNVAFFSVFLYPFLEWLDISIKIPQNTASTLLFGMLQILVLYIVSLLIEQLF